MENLTNREIAEIWRLLREGKDTALAREDALRLVATAERAIARVAALEAKIKNWSESEDGNDTMKEIIEFAKTISAPCPPHIRPGSYVDEKGEKHYVAVGIECTGSEQPMRDGKFCPEPECGRDMTYKLRGR